MHPAPNFFGARHDRLHAEPYDRASPARMSDTCIPLASPAGRMPCAACSDSLTPPARPSHSRDREATMSNVHHFRGGDAPRPSTRARGPYRKSATKAEITRAVRAVEELGHTVYGLVVDGPKVR